MQPGGQPPKEARPDATNLILSRNSPSCRMLALGAAILLAESRGAPWLGVAVVRINAETSRRPTGMDRIEANPIPGAPLAIDRPPSATPRARGHSAFTPRTVGVFLPTILLLCVWTSYSEGVVSSTSFHSLSPPMNIVVALFFLTAVAAPVHHGL